LWRDYLAIVKDERKAWRCVLIVAMREGNIAVMSEVNRRIFGGEK